MKDFKTQMRNLGLFLMSIVKGKDVRVMSERAAALALLRQITASGKKNYVPKLGSQQYVMSAFADFELFVRALKIFNEVLEEQNVIPTQMVDLTSEETTIDAMMVSRTKHYLPADIVMEFVHEAVTLCEIMESTEELEVGKMAHNHRILARVYTSIKDVTIGLSQSLA